MERTTNRCPICGAYALAGDVCRPQCDPGNLRRAGIELTPDAEALLPIDRSDEVARRITAQTRTEEQLIIRRRNE